MTIIGTSYLSFLPLVSRVAPDARVLPTGLIDFTLDAQYQIDLTASVQSAQLLHPIQSVYIDSKDCIGGNTTLQVFGTGQRVTAPANTQGYYPILCTQNSFVFTMTNEGSFGMPPGTGSVYIYFLTIPVVAAQWQSMLPGSGGFGVGPQGANPFGS